MSRPSRIRWLSDDELNAIYDDSLNILWERGMSINHSGARSMLSDAGAKINDKNDMVCFPPELVERSIETAPANFKMGGRTLNSEFNVGLDCDTITRPVTGTIRYVGLHDRTNRLGTAEDLKEWIRLLDEMNNVHIASGFLINDIPKETHALFTAKTTMENTIKPFVSSVDDPKQLKAMIDMVIAIRGTKKALRDQPLMTCFVSAKSPAFLPDYCIENMILAGKYGIPIELNAGPLLGATAPITIAGTLVQMNLELLSMLVISQLANNGTPVIYRPTPFKMDMSTGVSGFAAIELSMAYGAFAQIAKEKLQIPVGCVGMITDAVTTDSQSQIQRTTQTILSAMSGASILSGSGVIDQVNTVDPVQLVIDNEILDNVFRCLRGFEVNEETRCKELIKKIGPDSQFLTESHTLKYFRSEFINSSLFNSDVRDAWEEKGAKDLNKMAQEKAIKILEEHEVVPIENHVKQEIDKIYNSFKKK